jgi:branched-chain amino acid transport system permease protein
VVTTLTTHWMAVVGAVFMVFVLFFPAGVWGTLLRWLARSQRAGAT